MSFEMILMVALVSSAIISAMDKWNWAKKRAQAADDLRQKNKNVDFERIESVLKKPEWVEFSDTIFVLSCAVGVVWLMLPNFELILVTALFLSALIAIVEKTWLAKKKKQQLADLYKRNSNPHDKEVEAVEKDPWWADYGWSFFPLLLVIVVLRSFFYEPFKIPSSSMEPTLWVHDFILVNKHAYGLRLPVTKTRITEGEQPKRGDVVVFRAPHEPTKDYIKRLIALPGDVVYLDPYQQLWVKPKCNGPEEYTPQQLKCGVKNKIEHSLVAAKGFNGIDVYKENLDGVEHEIMIKSEFKSGRPQYSPRAHAEFKKLQLAGQKIDKRIFFARFNTFIEDWKRGVEVPEGSYFVLGDNRNQSLDSRFWGFVPEQRMVGKAEAIWLHLEFGFEDKGKPWSYIPTGVNFDRVGGIK
ncbi:signal peptidase I [Pleionea sp. CnH1-48]|uniref:signal peptidase I n=1 Tax=Pleionea sp. CnH1-48 TaxID=2954494 RepID=UPI0020980335|nr:signal peptidase I [Pleionea sp. CnH1-48]MCO7225468.1 signal peptidase I [Pleionea sp. CnH1-48]